ncbi:hypothetical protein TNCV_1073891 [Trichonephila clavipes]|uniref:Uncharacterized protein n=1 Tax=Trichonephila clavipes TaxID=2585209 RepID=A0A8X6SPR2_TRICX|nr:hypothetical protein TNCV_1073891 [Trichonephila clavipes]
MGRIDAAIRCWKEWVDSGRFQHHDGRDRLRATADREDRFIGRFAVAAPDSSLSTIRLEQLKQTGRATNRPQPGRSRKVERRMKPNDELVFALTYPQSSTREINA